MREARGSIRETRIRLRALALRVDECLLAFAWTLAKADSLNDKIALGAAMGMLGQLAARIGQRQEELLDRYPAGEEGGAPMIPT